MKKSRNETDAMQVNWDAQNTSSLEKQDKEKSLAHFGMYGSCSVKKLWQQKLM